MNPESACPYETLSREEKLKKLFDQQKHFLERGAISKAEYDKSLSGLISKIAKE